MSAPKCWGSPGAPHDLTIGDELPFTLSLERFGTTIPVRSCRKHLHEALDGLTRLYDSSLKEQEGRAWLRNRLLALVEELK